MTKGRPLTVILRFMLPLLLGNIFQTLYNMVDTIIVGRFVSSEALAAVGATGTIMFLVLGFAQGLTTGFTILTSQSYGANDLKRVRRSVANGILLSAILVVVITALSILIMKPLLRLMNTPADIFDDAYVYITIICAGSVCSVYYNLFAAYLRAVGNSKVPLYFLIFSAILNVILDLILIIIFDMGVAGAALATDISQGISAILCFVFIYRKVKVLRPERKEWRLTYGDTACQMRIGIPMALQFAITAGGTMIMQTAINLFGSVAVASFTAAAKLHNIVVQGMPAMGQAMATYCGQNYGKGDLERLKKGVHSAFLTNIVYALAAAALSILLMENFMGIFFTDNVDMASVMPWARTYIHECVVFYIPLGSIFIFRNAMQGCGYGFLPMMGGVVELVSRLVCAVIAIRTMSYAVACACDPAAWVCAAVFTGICYLYLMRKIWKSHS